MFKKNIIFLIYKLQKRLLLHYYKSVIFVFIHLYQIYIKKQKRRRNSEISKFLLMSVFDYNVVSATLYKVRHENQCGDHGDHNPLSVERQHNYSSHG